VKPLHPGNDAASPRREEDLDREAEQASNHVSPPGEDVGVAAGFPRRSEGEPPAATGREGPGPSEAEVRAALRLILEIYGARGFPDRETHQDWAALLNAHPPERVLGAALCARAAGAGLKDLKAVKARLAPGRVPAGELKKRLLGALKGFGPDRARLLGARAELHIFPGERVLVLETAEAEEVSRALLPALSQAGSRLGLTRTAVLRPLPPDLATLWAELKAALQAEFAPASFRTFIAPLMPLGLKGRRLVLAGSRLTVGWAARYRSAFNKAAAGVGLLGIELTAVEGPDGAQEAELLWAEALAGLRAEGWVPAEGLEALEALRAGGIAADGAVTVLGPPAGAQEAARQT
jgi:hypothetical protein